MSADRKDQKRAVEGALESDADLRQRAKRAAKEAAGTDHKAEALDHLTTGDMYLDQGNYKVASHHQNKAFVLSNLAIAEGQERVVEALEGRADTWSRQALEEIRALAADQGEANDNEVRKRIFHIADDGLERANS